MTEEFYIGQEFETEYPPEAAIWCNENGAMIEALEDGGFKIVEQPEPEPPTKEEISALREQAYIKEVDILHAQKMRKTILGTWTEEDEANYIAEVKRGSEDIANRYPYIEEV